MLWSRQAPTRSRLDWAAWILCGQVLLACSGGGFTTRPDSSSPDDEEPELPSERQQADVEQATLPEGRIDPAAHWTSGDEAFRAGDMRTAQEEFGLVYVADPSFRGGQVRAALLETCRALGNDCGLVMGRLDLLIIDYANLVGPRDQWVPQQEADYQSILSCYDEGLANNYDAAYYAGYAALNAPLPQFAQMARVCVDRVDALRTQEQLYELHQQAEETWDESFAAYSAAYARLEPAIEAGDWDAIVDVYPGYKLAEGPVADIVDAGLLSSDPARADDVAQASEWLQAVVAWEQGEGAQYDAMRDAVRQLDDDPDYNQALMEYQEIYNRLPPLEDEISSLQLAANATSGDDRASIERRIEAKEAEVREVRRELRRVMSTINSMRRDVGLPVRDTPHGME